MVILQLLVIIGLNVYLPWRLGALLGLQSKVWLYILFSVGLVSGIASLFIVTRFDNILVNAYCNLTWAWLGVLLYLSCFMIIFEVVNLIRKLPPVTTGWTIIVLTALISMYSLFNASFFKVANIAIPVKNLKNEIKIVQISDVHLGIARGRSYLAEVVKAANELKPDFIVITGDIADGKAALNRDMFAPLKDLQRPAFFVYGNHDVYVGLDEIIKKMRENNVTVMQNEVLIVNDIKLVGINYMKADDTVHDPHQVTDKTIKDILPTLDLSGDNPKVVLHHGPWGVEYMNEHGVDLVLAGHTHAGQVFPLSLMAKMRFPYNRGLAEYKGTYIYVSQGAGTFLAKMRLGTSNEINLITLTPAP